MKSKHRWLGSVAYTDTICNGLWVLPRGPPKGCLTQGVGTPGKLQEDGCSEGGGEALGKSLEGKKGAGFVERRAMR